MGRPFFMSPRQRLKHGNCFPLDAPDEWWECGAGAMPPPPEDWAHAAARGVVAELQDRSGIKNQLERQSLDQEVRKEIIQSIAAIIREASVTRWDWQT